MNNKALVIIDLQNDYLWDQRKHMFSYDTASLIETVNRTAAEYKQNGWTVIYIGQIFPNLITNKLLIGFSIKNTPGAELFSGLNLVSDLYFEKNLPDSFSSAPFRKYIEDNNIKELAVCGLDECGCVGATAKGAVKRGYNVSLISQATVSRFPKKKIRKMRTALKELGVKYI